MPMRPWTPGKKPRPLLICALESEAHKMPLTEEQKARAGASRRLRESSPEIRAEKARKQALYREEHAAEIASHVAKHNALPAVKLANRATAQRRELRVKYGLTSGEYDAMLTGQQGVCAICKRPPREERLAVDHCHTTGKIRGLLCPGFSCNTGLGHFAHSPELLEAAAAYLRRAR